MNQIACDYSIVLDSPLGRLGVCLQAGHLTRLNYLPKSWRLRPATTALEQGVVQQLEAYFADPRNRFKLPLEMHGTPFQLRVWQALQSILRVPPLPTGNWPSDSAAGRGPWAMPAGATRFRSSCHVTGSRLPPVSAAMPAKPRAPLWCANSGCCGMKVVNRT